MPQRPAGIYGAVQGRWELAQAPTPFSLRVPLLHGSTTHAALLLSHMHLQPDPLIHSSTQKHLSSCFGTPMGDKNRVI